jgi:hypothetical protein
MTVNEPTFCCNMTKKTESKDNDLLYSEHPC